MGLESTPSAIEDKKLNTASYGILKLVLAGSLPQNRFEEHLFTYPNLRKEISNIIQKDDTVLRAMIQKIGILDILSEDIIKSNPDFFFKKIDFFRGGDEIVRTNFLNILYKLNKLNSGISSAIIEGTEKILKEFPMFDAKTNLPDLDQKLAESLGIPWKGASLDMTNETLSLLGRIFESNSMIPIDKMKGMIKDLDIEKYNIFISKLNVGGPNIKNLLEIQFPTILDTPNVNKEYVLRMHWLIFHDLSQISPFLDDTMIHPKSIKDGLVFSIADSASIKYASYEAFKDATNKITTISDKSKDIINTLAKEHYVKTIKSISIPGQSPLKDKNGKIGSNKEGWEDIAVSIKPEWIILSSGKELTYEKKQRYIVYIARNFSFEGKTEKDVTKESVENMINTIELSQKSYGNLGVFSKRNVLFMANSEKVGRNSGEKLKISHKFARQSTQDEIKLQSGSFSFVRPENNKKQEELAKSQILEQIIKTPPPFTFIFDGHGSPDMIYLSGGSQVDGKIDKKNIVGISVEELVQAYSERIKKWRGEDTDPNMEQKDIFVFGACYSANFSKQFLSKLDNVQKPIIIGESEYNQQGIGNNESKFGGNFMENILDLKSKKPTTISTIIDAASEQKSDPNKNSSSFIYIPTEKGALQISALEKEYNAFA